MVLETLHDSIHTYKQFSFYKVTFHWRKNPHVRSINKAEC
jgi:hypothetical protein